MSHRIVAFPFFAAKGAVQQVIGTGATGPELRSEEIIRAIFVCFCKLYPSMFVHIDIGIKSAGHVTSPGRVNIQMNRPEGHQAKVTTSVFLRRSIICHARPGVAVHSSTVFVADTQNHRIIMVRSLDRCVVQSVNVVFSSQKIDKNSTLHAHWSGNSFLEGANP